MKIGYLAAIFETLQIFYIFSWNMVVISVYIYDVKDNYKNPVAGLEINTR